MNQHHTDTRRAQRAPLRRGLAHEVNDLTGFGAESGLGVAILEREHKRAHGSVVVVFENGVSADADLSPVRGIAELSGAEAVAAKFASWFGDAEELEWT